MSREDSKTTTGKKSYSEVVSPFKKKKKKKKATSNSFFSLSEESRYPSSLPPRKTITMGKNVNVDATNVSPTGSQNEPSLHEKLEELIPSVATGTKNNPHEIILGLKASGTTTWIDFVRMDEADIPLIKYFANGANITLSAPSLRLILRIKQMIWKNVRNKMPNAKLASTYTTTMLEH